MVVELRKRKAPAPPPAPAKKTKTTKAKASAPAAKPKKEPVKKAEPSKRPVPVVGDKIDLDGFGGEIETNDGDKTTLKDLLEESKSGIVLFTYPRASTPGCELAPFFKSLSFPKRFSSSRDFPLDCALERIRILDAVLCPWNSFQEPHLPYTFLSFHLYQSGCFLCEIR